MLADGGRDGGRGQKGGGKLPMLCKLAEGGTDGRQGEKGGRDIRMVEERGGMC